MKKIAIFDDDEDILSICAYILEEKEWEVVTFSDCNMITERVREVMPAVILMDNWIPDEGGIIATRKLKGDPVTAAIPVIYFSANSDIKALAEAAQADSFLAKPFDLNELEAAIDRVIVN